MSIFLRIAGNAEIRLVVLSQSADFIGGIVLIKLLTNLMSKEDYGYYALATSIMAFVSVLPFAVFDQGVARFVSIYKEKDSFNRAYINILVIYIFFLAFYVLVFWIVRFLLIENNVWLGILLVLPILICFETIKTTMLAVENANRHRKAIAYAKIFDSLAKIILIVSVFFLSELNVERLIMVLATSSLAVLGCIALKNRAMLRIADIHLQKMRGIFKDVWFFSYPLLIWSVFAWCQNMTNRWFINAFMDEVDVAEFSLLASLAMVPPNFILGIIAAFCIPVIYEKENIQPGYARTTINRLLYGVAAIYLLLIVIVSVCREELVTIFSNATYTGNSWMLPYMLGAAAFYALSSISTYEMYAHKKTARLILPNVIPGVFSVVFGYFAVKNYHVEGALLNYVATYVLCGALIFLQTWRYRATELIPARDL